MENPTPSKVFFTHMHMGRGRVTLAIKRIDRDWIDVAISFCSPKDQFNKKKGRMIATGRLNNGGSKRFSFNSHLEGVAIVGEAKSQFAAWTMENRIIVPKWLRRHLSMD